MPPAWEGVAKARQEELRREADQARLARSRTRGDRTRLGRLVAVVLRLAGRAARVLQPRPSGSPTSVPRREAS